LCLRHDALSMYVVLVRVRETHTEILEVYALLFFLFTQVSSNPRDHQFDACNVR
jgi:hypothetical protein